VTAQEKNSTQETGDGDGFFHSRETHGKVLKAFEVRVGRGC